MKIGGPEPGPEIPLPIEVIECIVDYVAILADPDRRQASLWSLCLISNAWYSASVKYLYHSPVLGTKNFEFFTRTLCPPVRPKDRVVGLENLVVNLQMGGLAYITTKAITAKLLRRVRNSLQSFVAPSFSMSISSLAPISHLEELQHLDLSRDKYDFDLQELLRATRNLHHLQFLSLPRGAIDDYRSDAATSISWPQSLDTLQINASVPPLSLQRQYFFADLHANIHTLIFRYIQNWRQITLLFMKDNDSVAPSVKSVRVADVGGSPMFLEELELGDILQGFPALERLDLPITTLDCPYFTRHAETWDASVLQDLTFHDGASRHSIGRAQLKTALMIIIPNLRYLRRLQFPAGHGIDAGNCWGHNVDHDNLVNRAVEGSEDSAGLFIMDCNGKLWRWTRAMDWHAPRHLTIRAPLVD